MKVSFLLPLTVFSTIAAANSNFIIQFKNNNYDFDTFFANYYNLSNDTLDVPFAASSFGLQSFEIGSNFKGVLGEFNIDIIRNLYYDSKINAISIDRDLVLADVQEFAPKHLARISQKQTLNKDQKLDYVYDATGGIGVDVYILDSGIFSSHPDFSKRVTKIFDFTEEPVNRLEDSIGHGTYIAGVVGSETYGVAKKANLFDVKVTKKDGRTKLSSVINALNLILKDSKITNRPTVIVMPLIMKKNAILNGAIEAIVKEGIPVIVPAGNDGKNACEYSPASAKGALTVGSIDTDSDQIATFSNWGPCVDIFAPGTSVQTTDNKGDKVVLKSGTSLSTGIVGGLVAYFMSMGDTGASAVSKILDIATSGKIPSSSFEGKSLTENKIIYNLEGHPNWI